MIAFLYKKKSKISWKVQERERSEYNKIPDLENLIGNYVYKQMVDLQREFKNIRIESLDYRVHQHLNSKINIFVKYLDLEGYSLTEYQIELLKEDCFKVSEPIRKELRLLIKDHMQREQIRREKESKEREIREKAKMTRELFGKEIIKKEDIKKIKKYKTIDEEIDGLIRGYENWEYSKEGKKEK